MCSEAGLSEALAISARLLAAGSRYPDFEEMEHLTQGLSLDRKDGCHCLASVLVTPRNMGTGHHLVEALLHQGHSYGCVGVGCPMDAEEGLLRYNLALVEEVAVELERVVAVVVEAWKHAQDKVQSNQQEKHSDVPLVGT